MTTTTTTAQATAAPSAESVRFYLFAIVVNEIRKFLSQSEDHWQPKQTVLCCRRILNQFIHVLALVPCECVTYSLRSARVHLIIFFYRNGRQEKIETIRNNSKKKIFIFHFSSARRSQ